MTTVTQQTLIPTGIWKSDPIHSRVGFAVKHAVIATFRGDFADYDVTLANEDGEPRLYGAVRAGSVEVPDPKLNGHLLSPDFFDVERHPEITFTSSKVNIEDGGLVVPGKLTIKGTTKDVEARGTIVGPVEYLAGGERLGIELETSVDRTDSASTGMPRCRAAASRWRTR